jgi:hypothetical protein
MHGSLEIQVNTAGDEEKTLDQLVGDDDDHCGSSSGIDRLHGSNKGGFFSGLAL